MAQGDSRAVQLTGEADELLLAPAPEGLVREFEQLGLSLYESSVLLALLRLGSATSLQLAQVSSVPRTSTYQVLQELMARRLAIRVSAPGPAVWASPGRDEVLARLDAAQEDRLRQHRERAARVREMLAESLPEGPSVAMPYVHVMHSAAQVRVTYDTMLADASQEFVVFNRPPYSPAANPVRLKRREIEARDEVNETVLDALGRGVVIRALYQAAQWDDPQAKPFRESMAAYHRAGVKGRLVEELPIKLAVADRRVALLTMTDPSLPEIGFPTTLLIDHPGCAAVQAEAFDRVWATGRACSRSPGPDRAGEPGRPSPG